jgi:hypothetical protein
MNTKSGRNLPLAEAPFCNPEILKETAFPPETAKKRPGRKKKPPVSPEGDLLPKAAGQETAAPAIFAPPLSGEEEARRILLDAVPRAFALLARTLEDESLKLDLRLEAAREIINRVYGKTPRPLEPGEEAQLRFVLEGELERLAE